MIQLFRNVAGPGLAIGGSVVCVGAFDGMHRGHRALLECARARAEILGLVPAAISFEPIPREFFARAAPVTRLASVREKIEGFDAAGIEKLLLLRFNEALASMPAETFVRDVLVARMRAQELWVGADFRFGHARRGDVAMLHELGLELGFRTEVMQEFCVDGKRVRSSRIRELLHAGEFDAAEKLLGRRFSIGGHVVRGKRLGRTLGYPTANLRLGERTAPVAGIFAVRVYGAGLDGWPGVASLGVRPTVGGVEPLLETHLFDFDADLYGQRIRVEFVAKLRDEEKFDDLDAMKRQMDRDALEARSILNRQMEAAT